MKFDSKRQHKSERKRVAVNALFCLLADQPDKHDFKDDIPTYEADKVHSIIENRDDIKAEPFTIRSIVSAQNKDF